MLEEKEAVRLTVVYLFALTPPGHNVEMDVELIVPMEIEDGLRFAVREGG